MRSPIIKFPGFVDTGKAILKPAPRAKRLRQRLYAIVLATPVVNCALAAPTSQPTATERADATPFDVAGYKENVIFPGAGSAIAQEQAKYLKDKAELLAAMDECTKKPKACDPHIKGFMDMIERAKKLSADRLAQLSFVQTYINNIPYDDDEAANTKSDMDHHTLKQALVYNLAVCDEVARLKLLALTLLGYPEKDLRWLAEDIYDKNSKFTGDGHAVTAVRLGSKVWIMDLPNQHIKADNHTGKKAELLASDNSELVSAGTQLNFSGHYTLNFCVSDRWASVDMLPTEAFNSSVARNFINQRPSKDLDNVPEAARNAPRDSFQLSVNEMRHYHILPTLLTNILSSYQTHPAQSAKKQKSTPPTVGCG